MRHNYIFIKISKRLEAFYHSPLYIALITLIGILGFAFKQEISAIFAVGILVAVGWVFVRDFTHTVISMLVIATVPLARYGQQAYFDPLFYLPIILVPALVLHIVNFPAKHKKAPFLIPTLAVAVAITLGGLFYLTKEQYFSMPALYYVLMLGFGMLIIYIFINNRITAENFMLADYYSKMMVGIGIMGIAMVASKYAELGSVVFVKSLNWISNNFQWGNNLSNVLLLAMPFAFYLATKGKHAVFYFCVGTLEYFAMFFTLSRGGMIFSTIEFPLLFLATVILAKKDRKKFIIPTLISIAAVIVVLIKLYPQLVNITEISGDEARAKMYRHAWESFLEYPIFGKGLAYNPGKYYFPQPMCIYWYHSTLFQVLGSLGAVGIIAYSLQFLYRARALIKVRSKLNLYAAITVIGFSGYSMVNVGYFAPFPCVALMLVMFTVIDRHNGFLTDNPPERAKEAIFKKDRVLK